MASSEPWTRDSTGAATGAVLSAPLSSAHPVPRPRRSALASPQALQRRTASSSPGLPNSPLSSENGEAGGRASGYSTPLPADAPPSVKSLSSARKEARAQQRRIFPTVDYESRVSHLDSSSDHRDFHGFFNLFWIGLAIMAITTMLRNLKDTGSPFRVRIWALFTVKLGHLAIADFAMAASTAFLLPLQRAVRAAPRTSVSAWARGGIVLQTVLEIFWLVFWIAVPFLFGDWPWTAQVFLLLHAMVLLMKMHSYTSYNGHLSETEKRLRALDDPATADTTPAYLYPTAEKPMGAVAPASATHHNPLDGRHDSSSDRRDDVAELRVALARELTSPMGNVTYPSNLTWANYLDYLACPTLCYELEYPRTDAVHWPALLSKIAAIFGCIFLLTVTSEEFILPVLEVASGRLAASTGSCLDTLLVLAESISSLLFPFMLTLLLVFLVIFEYVLGALAEITRFADRHFYSDWWNSGDWLTFSRKWNLPVHAFLRRHVYSASVPHLGRSMATAITFLVSAIAHEIVMACITKKLRGYGFVCQMMQLPLMLIQQPAWVRGRKTLYNVYFWCSMILGLSLICSLYVLI